DELSISIVNDYKDGTFKNYYRIFQLKRPVPNIGLIGVESLDQFALKVCRKERTNFSFSLYLDGLSVSQKSGIMSINDIDENDRADYNKHNQMICRNPQGNSTFFLDRFNQLSDKNRTFVFTDIHNTGVNEILLKDLSKTSRIEIYFWTEKSKDDLLISY